jgi:hypothetical protein
MALSRELLLFFVLALPSACGAQPRVNETYSFGQNDRGGWSSIDINDLPKYLNASQVTCSGQSSEIDVVWNSESGDWAAFDKYSSAGSFFRRTIRFAQFDQSIEIVQDYADSKPVMTFGGEDVKQYDFLLRELSIWKRESDLPFRLPKCAEQIFTGH